VTMQEAQEKVKNLSTLKETSEYGELEKLHQTGISPIKSHEITGSLKGRSNIISRLREMIQNAQKEIFISTTVLDFEDKARVLLPALEQAVKNDIKVKVALSGPLDRIKKINIKSNLKSNPTESDARLYVADKKELIFMITPEKSDEDIAVWLNSPFFAQSLHNIMDVPVKKTVK